MSENSNKLIKVGSRASRLAVIQSEIVMRQIEEADPDIRTELVTMKTTGDKVLDKTLDKIGGKGLFVKELDEALREGRVDITVHSMKDMPKDIPGDLPLVMVTKREDPRDVLVLPEGAEEIDMSLPAGTSSLRRSLQITELIPGIETAPVRGNVETRLRKLDEGQFSCLIMAAAGLKRMGLEHRISRYFEPEEMLPAACQGILAVQARAGEDLSRLNGIGSSEAMLCAMAERTFTSMVGADCGSPDTAYAYISDGMLHLTGMRYDPDACRLVRRSISGRATDAETIAKELADMMR